MDDKRFDITTDYDVLLLRLLAELPGGQGQAGEVCRLFSERYASLIPAEQYQLRGNGDPIWKNNVQWSRQHLKQYGFLDASKHGIWCITDTGRKWLKANPDGRHIDAVHSQTHEQPPREKPASKTPPTSGVTLEMLEQTRKIMLADQFRQLWGSIYDELVAKERAKATSEVSQTELGRRARLRIDEVQAFLRGRAAGRPSAEVLCQWIDFCYLLDLYREAAGLFAHVRQEEVDPAFYRRAKRIAEVCRAKLMG